MNRVLIITGIGDETRYIESATRHWAQKYDLEPTVHAFGWDGSKDKLEPRLNNLRERFNQIGARAVVGVSAGASAGVIIAAENSDVAYVNICGRVRKVGDSLYKFAQYDRRAPIFVEMVGRAEELLSDMNQEKSLVFRPYFDELVPGSAAMIDGAQHVTVPAVTHGLGIYVALRFYGERIARLAAL